MIFYKPIFDKEKLNEMFPNKLTNDNAVYGGYIAYEGETEVGNILIEINGYFSEILAVSLSEDKLLIEGLIRAALNFAGNRNAYITKCKIAEVDDVLTLLGFEKNNGAYSGEIPELLNGSCCKSK